MNISNLLNGEEARRLLGCTERRLKTLRQQRLIRFYRLGHRTVSYDRDSIERYLRARVVPAIGEAIR